MNDQPIVVSSRGNTSSGKQNPDRPALAKLSFSSAFSQVLDVSNVLITQDHIMDNKLSTKSNVVKPVFNFVGPLKSVSDVQFRDQTQSRRLHEPSSITSHTDPVTGNDVLGTEGRPFVKDGIMTVYFESEVTRQIYLDTPTNHPVSILNNVVKADDDRGG
ncbi:MAG: hypothetical protein WBO73_10705 [Gammaproteobacteria bacterium]